MGIAWSHTDRSRQTREHTWKPFWSLSQKLSAHLPPLDSGLSVLLTPCRGRALHRLEALLDVRFLLLQAFQRCSCLIVRLLYLQFHTRLVDIELLVHGLCRSVLDG